MATSRVAGALIALTTAAVLAGCHGPRQPAPTTTSSWRLTRDAGSECSPDQWGATDPSGLKLECWQRNSDKIELGRWWAVRVEGGDAAIGTPCPKDGIPGLTYEPSPKGSIPPQKLRMLMCQDSKWKNTPEGWPEGTSA